MIIDKKRFGDFLAQTRIEAGLSQLALAKSLGYSSPQYVSNWERALCGPPLEKLHDLSRVLKINPSLLMEMIMEDTRAYLNSELKLGGKVAKKAKKK